MCILTPLGYFSGSWVPETNQYQFYAIVFVTYLMSAFVLSYMQGVMTHIVYVRAHNGNATLGDGFKASKDQVGALFIWACITSTVGIILRIISDRSEKLTQIIAAILGVAWSVLTYFVVPSIIIDKKTGFNAVSHSGEVFKRTWGETNVTNIGIGLILFITIIAIALIFGGILIMTGSTIVVGLTLGVIFGTAFIGFVITATVLEGVLKTLLYIYAREGVMPTNFDAELLTQILGKKDVSQSTYPQGIAGA